MAKPTKTSGTRNPDGCTVRQPKPQPTRVINHRGGK